MNTHIFKPTEVDEIRKWLMLGKIVAFPTDTVFGEGVVWDNEDALNRLKLSKNRDMNKPIPMMVSSISQIEDIAEVTPTAKILMEKYMPGGFTIILKKKETVPSYVTNGKDTIAIRMPNDEFVLSLLSDKPLLVTSANLSGEIPGKTAEEVLIQMDGRIDAIVLGEAKEEVASTIVDATNEEAIILREGIISSDDIIATLKENYK